MCHSELRENSVVCFPKLSSKELESSKELSLSPDPRRFLWENRQTVPVTRSGSGCILNNGTAGHKCTVLALERWFEDVCKVKRGEAWSLCCFLGRDRSPVRCLGQKDGPRNRTCVLGFCVPLFCKSHTHFQEPSTMSDSRHRQSSPGRFSSPSWPPVGTWRHLGSATQSALPWSVPFHALRPAASIHPLTHSPVQHMLCSTIC